MGLAGIGRWVSGECPRGLQAAVKAWAEHRRARRWRRRRHATHRQPVPSPPTHGPRPRPAHPRSAHLRRLHLQPRRQRAGPARPLAAGDLRAVEARQRPVLACGPGAGWQQEEARLGWTRGAAARARAWAAGSMPPRSSLVELRCLRGKAEQRAARAARKDAGTDQPDCTHRTQGSQAVATSATGNHAPVPTREDVGHHRPPGLHLHGLRVRVLPRPRGLRAAADHLLQRPAGGVGGVLRVWPSGGGPAGWGWGAGPSKREPLLGRSTPASLAGAPGAPVEAPATTTALQRPAQRARQVAACPACAAHRVPLRQHVLPGGPRAGAVGQQAQVQGGGRLGRHLDAGGGVAVGAVRDGRDSVAACEGWSTRAGRQRAGRQQHRRRRGAAWLQQRRRRRRGGGAAHHSCSQLTA